MLDDLLTRAATGTPTITVTLTRGNRESLNLEQRTLTLDEFYARLSQHPVVSDKNTAEAIIPGVIGSCSTPCRNFDRPKSVDCGGGKPHRLMENVREISALFIDLDDWNQSDVEAYLQIPRDAGLEFFAYSSYSYAPPDRAKCRLVFPFVTPIQVGDSRHWRKHIWPALIRRVGLNPERIDSQCSDTSRLYYLPCRSSEGAPVWTASARGARLDTDVVLADVPSPPPRTLSIVPQSAVDMTSATREAIAASLRAHVDWPSDVDLAERAIAGQDISIAAQRHAGIIRLSWLLVEACPGIDDPSLIAFATPSLEAMGDERDFVGEFERALLGARHKVLRGETDDPQAAIIASNRAEQDGTDAGYAARFVRLFGQRALFLDGIGWHVWSGTHWTADARASKAIRMVFDMADSYESDLNALRLRAEVLRLEVETPTPPGSPRVLIEAKQRLAERLAHLEERIKSFRKLVISPVRNTARAKAVLQAAESDRLTRIEQMDALGHLLNTPSGTVDLKTGALLPHDPSHLITKITPCAYQPDAVAPQFQEALARSLPDADVRGFLQRAIGYGITGSIREQIMFLMVGRGGNGKSTLLVAVQEALGRAGVGYAATASKGIVTNQQFGQSKDYQLADLRGARLVQVMELNDHEVMASDRVKQVTGGEAITAARKFENQISFIPQAKLFMPCNEKPRVLGDDHGIWRRLCVIPFDVSFTETSEAEASRDTGIQERLRAEVPGILAWAVQGAVAWYTGGLQIPAKCRDATLIYREGENVTLQFFKECVDIDPASTVQAQAIYTRYVEWMSANGHRPLGVPRFSRAFREVLRAQLKLSDDQVYQATNRHNKYLRIKLI